jgi:hypothetical protein
MRKLAGTLYQILIKVHNYENVNVAEENDEYKFYKINISNYRRPNTNLSPKF